MESLFFYVSTAKYPQYGAHEYSWLANNAVGAVCHRCTRVNCSYAHSNLFEKCLCVSGFSIASIRPHNPAMAKHGLYNFSTDLKDMYFNLEVPAVCHVKK